MSTKFYENLILVVIGTTLFVCLEHVFIFKTYSSLQETCRIILK